MSHGPTEKKAPWRGRILGVQPRIRLLRSFDQRQHSYLGYVLILKGSPAFSDNRFFRVAIGKKAHEKHLFRAGDEVSGVSVPVADPELETAGLYKTSGLKLHGRETPDPAAADKPPYLVIPPPLPTYRQHGHRRLDARTYDSKCSSCTWGCTMPVEITLDQWTRSRGPDNVQRRMETFCYGPRECAFYKAGPIRKVRGRKPGMIHEDEGDTTTPEGG